MTDKLYGGSHEVKECFAEDVHGLVDRVMDDIQEEKIPRDVGFSALKAATDNPSVALRMIDQYTTQGSLDISAFTL